MEQSAGEHRACKRRFSFTNNIGKRLSPRARPSRARPSSAKSPIVEKSLLDSLRVSLKEEITSGIKNLLSDSPKEILRLLKPKTRENVREKVHEEPERETRKFYTSSKSVRTNSTHNDDPSTNRNTIIYQHKVRVFNYDQFRTFLLQLAVAAIN